MIFVSAENVFKLKFDSGCGDWFVYDFDFTSVAPATVTARTGAIKVVSAHIFVKFNSYIPVVEGAKVHAVDLNDGSVLTGETLTGKMAQNPDSVSNTDLTSGCIFDCHQYASKSNLNPSVNMTLRSP